MSRATNRTSNISVTWNFKNPNISRNELINFIHLFRDVPGYSRGLSRHSESFPKGFPPRFSVLPKVSRLCLLKSRDSCCLSISLQPRGLHQAPYLHFQLSSFIFHRTPARKSSERLFSPSQHPPESFLTTPPEISRFPFGTKVIKILDLSPTNQAVHRFSYTPLFPKASPSYFQSQSFTNHATRPNSLLSFINLLARSILISPCLTTTLISPVHHFLQLPSSLSRQFTMHCYPSVWQFRARRAGNCTEFEAVSAYVTLKKNNLHHLKESFRSISFFISHVPPAHSFFENRSILENLLLI